MSKGHVTVRPHVRRTPTRVVVTTTPAPEEPKPALPRATSPMQESGYEYWPYDQSRGIRQYSDTIADRAMTSDDDNPKDEEY